MDTLFTNLNKANLDQNQMYNRVFDDKKDTLRVSVIDGVQLKVDNITMPEFKLPEQNPIVIKEIQLQEIKVPEIIREVQIERIEIPVFHREVEIQYIDKPIIVPEVRIIEIEKPIIIKEIELRIVEQKIYEMPMVAKVCMIVQALALIGILLTKTL